MRNCSLITYRYISGSGQHPPISLDVLWKPADPTLDNNVAALCIKMRLLVDPSALPREIKGINFNLI